MSHKQTMNSSASLASRAMLAVFLMAGFYCLALGISALLLYIPYAEWTYAGRLHIKLALVCIVGAGVILWSILPRLDRFVAPGPQLTPDNHPRLFSELQTIARAVQQEMPAEVYLVHNVNAWVMQRGGFMGWQSRRVMGLGLPLMRIVTVSQLRAILAHEFGHYHAGDTKLGPWIYKTRNAIVRTVQTLAGERGQGSLLQLPFVWYGKLFLRITHAVSRRQEFVADELAARTVGSAPLIAGLRAVHALGQAFDPFWANVMAPVLNAGYRPPMVEGFQQFVQAKNIADALSKSLEEELNRGKADPYDTHPSLKDRIAAVHKWPAGATQPDDPMALSLLEDVPDLETQLLAVLAGAETVAKLETLEWDDVGAKVYLPPWTKLVQANADRLSAITPASLIDLAAQIDQTARKFVTANGDEPPETHYRMLASSVIGSALMLALLSRGWKLCATPGSPVSVHKGSEVIQPFAILESLASGSLAPDQWRQQCSAGGITAVDFGRLAGARNQPPIISECVNADHSVSASGRDQNVT